MQHLGDYCSTFRHLNVEQYLAADPPHVLLHHLAASPMKPTSGTPPETIYRLAVGDTPPAFPSAAVIKEKAFAVYPVAAEPGQRSFVLGCSLKCDIYINDVSVSREHAVIDRRGNEFRIRDNNSTSGTWVQRKLLQPGETRLLNSSDEVVVGGVELIFLTPEEFFMFSTRFLRR